MNVFRLTFFCAGMVITAFWPCYASYQHAVDALLANNREHFFQIVNSNQRLWREKDKKGITLLHHIARLGKPELVEKLDWPACSVALFDDAQGNNPLKVAFSHDNIDFAAQAIDYSIGKNNRPALNGEIPTNDLFRACNRIQDTQVQHKLSTILKQLCLADHIEPRDVVKNIRADIDTVLKLLIKKKNYDDEIDFGNLLDFAAANRHSTQPLKTLREIFGDERFDAYVCKPKGNSFGNTLLHLAVLYQNLDSVKMLVKSIPEADGQREKFFNSTRKRIDDILITSLYQKYNDKKSFLTKQDFDNDLKKISQIAYYLRSVGSPGFSDTIFVSRNARKTEQLVNDLGKKYSIPDAYGKLLTYHKQGLLTGAGKTIAVVGILMSMIAVGYKLWRTYKNRKVSHVSDEQFDELVVQAEEVWQLSSDSKDFEKRIRDILSLYSDAIINRVIMHVLQTKN